MQENESNLNVPKNLLGPRGDFATDRQAERQFGYLPNAFDNEYDYFKDQLTAYKLYKISDTITDRGVKQHDDE